KTRAKMFPLSDTQQATVTAAVATGRKWLTVVTNRFNLDVIFPTAVVNDTRTKTKNVFDFDPFPPPDDPAAVIDSLQKVIQLRENYGKLRAAYDKDLEAEAMPMPLFFSAFVFPEFEDATVRFLPSYFDADKKFVAQVATLIHERAHTELRA